MMTPCIQLLMTNKTCFTVCIEGVTFKTEIKFFIGHETVRSITKKQILLIVELFMFTHFYNGIKKERNI